MNQDKSSEESEKDSKLVKSSQAKQERVVVKPELECELDKRDGQVAEPGKSE